MKRALALVFTFSILVATLYGCDRRREASDFTELHGTWETTMPMMEAGIGDEEPLADDQVEQTIALPEDVSQQLMNIPLRQTFASDGSFVLEVGVQRFDGSWNVADRDGEQIYVVVRLDAAEGRSERRLVELVEVIDENTVRIGDEQGNAREFERVAR